MPKKIEYMPNEYKGETYFDKHNETYSRKWTEEEIKWMKYLIDKGYTTKEIAESMGRGVTSVSIKKKRLTKKDKTYNQKHYREKVKLNKHFLKAINPSSVLDLYNGGSLVYENYNATTNDISKDFETDYRLWELEYLVTIRFTVENKELFFDMMGE